MSDSIDAALLAVCSGPNAPDLHPEEVEEIIRAAVESGHLIPRDAIRDPFNEAVQAAKEHIDLFEPQMPDPYRTAIFIALEYLGVCDRRRRSCS